MLNILRRGLGLSALGAQFGCAPTAVDVAQDHMSQTGLDYSDCGGLIADCPGEDDHRDDIAVCLSQAAELGQPSFAVIEATLVDGMRSDVFVVSGVEEVLWVSEQDSREGTTRRPEETACLTVQATDSCWVPIEGLGCG